MTTDTPVNTNADILHIYEGWHQAVVNRDLESLMRLYATDALFETPLILAVMPDRSEGILRGSSAIRSFFEAGFRTPGNGLGRWYRNGTFFSDGQQLTWEYPRQTPHGDQVDLVEFMDVADGRITHHRVYWAGSVSITGGTESGQHLTDPGIKKAHQRCAF